MSGLLDDIFTSSEASKLLLSENNDKKGPKYKLLLVSKTNCISCAIAKGTGSIYENNKPIFGKDNKWDEQFFINIMRNGLVEVSEFVFSNTDPSPKHLSIYRKYHLKNNNIEYDEYYSAGKENDLLGYKYITRKNQNPPEIILCTSFRDTANITVPGNLTVSVMNYPGFIFSEIEEWNIAIHNPIYVPKFYSLGYVHSEVFGGWVIDRENTNLLLYNLPNINKVVDDVLNGIIDMKKLPPKPEIIKGLETNEVKEKQIGGFEIEDFTNGLNYALVPSTFRSMDFDKNKDTILQNMTKDLNDKKDEIAELLDEVNKMENSLELFTSEIKDLNESVENKNREVFGLTDKVHQLENRLEESLKSNSGMDADKETLLTQFRKISEENLIKDSDIALLNKEIDNKANENNKLTKRVEDLLTYNKTIESKKDELTIELGYKCIELESMHSINNENNILKNKLEAQLETKKINEQEIERLKDEISTLKYEIKMIPTPSKTLSPISLPTLKIPKTEPEPLPISTAPIPTPRTKKLPKATPKPSAKRVSSMSRISSLAKPKKVIRV